MQDIAPELLEKIQKTFREKIAQNKKLEAISKHISENNGSYKEAAELSVEVGKALSEAFAEHLSSESLPDGKMYYNIAERILNPTLKENHRIISDASSKVQESLNRKANIGIRAIRPKMNQDRIDGLITKVSDRDIYDEVAWVLNEPVVNFSQNIVDEFIHENASFHSKVGLSPRIVRTLHNGACEFCQKRQGEHKYPGVRQEVFQRHRYCRCVVDYIPGNGKRQNVHNKKWKKDKLDVEKVRKLGYNKISGAITDVYSKKADDHASLYYEEIRHRTTDVSKIAKNTGYDEKFIQEIKNYLFMDKHNLQSGYKRFDPDFMIAQSWQRLQQGNIEKHDLTLLKHEELERKLIRNGMTQNRAHIETSKKYNYQKEADLYYDYLKKRKKRK